jgi:anti-sigma regulatory factor (Ser/Thr protein kinase)
MSYISISDLTHEFGADRVTVFAPQSDLQPLSDALTPQIKLAIESDSQPVLTTPPEHHVQHLRRLNGIGFTLSTQTIMSSDVSAMLSQRLLYLIGLSDAARGTLRTVLHETLLNAAIHGNMNIHSPKITTMADYGRMHAAISTARADTAVMARKITVIFTPDAHLVRFAVCDEGTGFDTGRLQTDLRDMTETKANGRGLKMVQAMTAELLFHDGGCVVEFAISR